MFDLQATIEKIESQVTDDQSRQAFLVALKARLAERLRAEADSGLTRITKEKDADSGDSGESALEPQPFPAECEVIPSESAPPFSDSCDPVETPENARLFAAALDKLDPALRGVAADLYEHLHYKSKFARLTSAQRESVVQLLRHHRCEDVAEIIAQPPPIGISLRTSKAGVIRFREDYLRCAMEEQKRRSQQIAEQQRSACEQSFKAATASDNSFRDATKSQIRKRLFRAVHDPDSDYHEIRWLLKSLDMLNEDEANN